MFEGLPSRKSFSPLSPSLGKLLSISRFPILNSARTGTSCIIDHTSIFSRLRMQGQAYILLCMHINILLALPFQSDNRFGSKDESFPPFCFCFWWHDVIIFCCSVDEDLHCGCPAEYGKLHIIDHRHPKLEFLTHIYEYTLHTQPLIWHTGWSFQTLPPQRPKSQSLVRSHGT